MESLVGKIFIEKNIIFKRTGNEKCRQVDHVYSRPALIIAESSDYIYYLKLSSRYGCTTTLADMKYSYKGEKHSSYVGYDQIFRKPICFINPVNEIYDSKLLEILLSLKRYNERVDEDEFYSEISDTIDNLIKEYSLKFDKNTKKLKL